MESLPLHVLPHNGWLSSPWAEKLKYYVKRRYYSIEERLMDTFRFVELSPENKNTYSYEFSSILRDSGSVFDSFMRRLLQEINSRPNGDYNIDDFAQFFRERDLEGLAPPPTPTTNIGMAIRDSKPKRCLFPLRPMDPHGQKPAWWNAHNDVKHSDIEHQQQGNLLNCLNAVGALAVLYELTNSQETASTNLFEEIGLYAPIDETQVF